MIFLMFKIHCIACNVTNERVYPYQRHTLWSRGYYEPLLWSFTITSILLPRGVTFSKWLKSWYQAPVCVLDRFTNSILSDFNFPCNKLGMYTIGHQKLWLLHAARPKQDSVNNSGITTRDPSKMITLRFMRFSWYIFLASANLICPSWMGAEMGGAQDTLVPTPCL